MSLRHFLSRKRWPASATAVGRALPQAKCFPHHLTPLPYPVTAAVFADLNLDVRAGSIVTACICMLAACVAVAAMARFKMLGPAVAYSGIACLSVIVPLAFMIGRANRAGGFPVDPTAACQHPAIAAYFGADFGGVAAEFSIWTRATYVISLVWCVLSTPLLALLAVDLVKSGG